MSFTLIIQPHDVVLFRDGKPFSAGMDTRARSLFPPTPFTIQGAIRARVLFSSGLSLAEYYEQKTSKAQELLNLISAPDKGYGQLRLKGPFLARREKNSKWVPYFPLPADVVKVGAWYKFLQPLEESPWQSNAPDKLHPLWIRTIDRVEEVRGWISQESLREYLEGKFPLFSREATCGEGFSRKVLGESDFVEREHRFGIALERGRRTVRDSHLYLAEFLRLKEELAFWVEVDGIDQSKLGGEEGFLQLGGEARAAYYEVTKQDLDLSIPPSGPLPKRFKVVLLTPAWFSGGWRPENENWGAFFKGSVRLISAVIPRYQAMGGAYASHQQTKGIQRPMRRFVPAGSVYFFECDSSVSWAHKPFTETPPGEGDYGQIGFGFCVITRSDWNYA